MNRRRLLWSAVALLLVGRALAVVFDTGLLRWPWGLESHVRSVRVGMSEGEVDEVLGGPPAIKAPWTDPESGALLQPGWRAVWYSKRGNVAVDFNAEGKVNETPIFAPPRQ